jgi:hypothetical protein
MPCDQRNYRKQSGSHCHTPLVLFWSLGACTRGIRRLRARKSAIRRFLSAESPDRSPRTTELCPERFGGERRHILRGRGDSQSSHLTAMFLKRAFASSCAGACRRIVLHCVVIWPLRTLTRPRDGDGEPLQYSLGTHDNTYPPDKH